LAAAPAATRSRWSGSGRPWPGPGTRTSRPSWRSWRRCWRPTRPPRGGRTGSAGSSTRSTAPTGCSRSRTAAPSGVLFAITEKRAAAFAAGHVPTPSGSVYAREDLARLRVAQVRDHLGADFSDGATSDGITLDPVKAAELLPTLTRRDAELFDRMAAAAGVAPAYKEAAARREGLTADDLRELAAAHRPR
jgi:hypothetical protein